MNGSGLTASDVLAITRDDGAGFGGVGGFILLFIFLIALGGGGFGWGGSSGLALADIQASLYNQTQDANARSLAQGQAGITDAILNASYNNLIASKDLTTQIANQTAVLTNAMNSNTSAILGQMTSNVIDELRDKLAVTRDELSNTRQTATITQNVLGSLATIAPKPPCYYNCGCNPSL